MDIEIGGETFHKEPNLLEQIAYRDTWGRGADSFIAMIYERLILMRDLMHNEGSIYVHCDWRVNSYYSTAWMKSLASDSFKNEIIWQRTVHSARQSRPPSRSPTIRYFCTARRRPDLGTAVSGLTTNNTRGSTVCRRVRWAEVIDLVTSAPAAKGVSRTTNCFA